MTNTKGVDPSLTPSVAPEPSAQPLSETAAKTGKASPDQSEFIRQEISKNLQKDEAHQRRRDRKWSRPSEGSSLFEAKLKKAEEGNEMIAKVKSRPRFPQKSEEGWQNFFTSLLSMGKREKKISRQASEVSGGSFRGLLSRMKGFEGPVMVADLRYVGSTLPQADKFTRILLKKEGAENFSALTPGDELPGSVLENLGDEIHYVKLEGETGQPGNAGAQGLLTHLRNQGSPTLANRMEISLAQQRAEQKKALQQKKTQPQSSIDDKVARFPLFYIMMGILGLLVLYAVLSR